MQNITPSGRGKVTRGNRSTAATGRQSARFGTAARPIIMYDSSDEEGSSNDDQTRRRGRHQRSYPKATKAKQHQVKSSTPRQMPCKPVDYTAGCTSDRALVQITDERPWAPGDAAVDVSAYPPSLAALSVSKGVSRITPDGKSCGMKHRHDEDAVLDSDGNQ